MRKNIWKKMLVCGLSACLLAGCGGAGKQAGNSASSGTAETSQASGSTSETGNDTSESGTSSEENSGKDASSSGETASDDSSSSENSASSEKTGQDASENGAEETATPEPTAKPVTQKSRAKKGKEIYDDNTRTIQCLGLKEYKKLGEKETLDKPADGNVFLVLFLKVYNMNEEEDLYIHEKYVSAKVDGKNVEHTFLRNYPNGYGSIFKNIDPNGSAEGFIVWEVPKNWKKLVVNFSEFGLLGGKNLKISATRKDLAEPKKPSNI